MSAQADVQLAPTVPSWWEARVGGLPRPFWYLFAGTLINKIGAFVLPFLSLFLTRARGLSLTQTGLVLTVMGAGSAISQPVGGVLADRLGRRRTMVLGLVAAGISLLGVGAAHALPALCAAVFVYGISSDIYRPASSAAVADLVDPEVRPRAFALLFWALNLGFAVATPLGGFLADHGYRLLFLLDAATSVAFAGVILRGVPETRPERHADSPGSLREVLRDRLMLALVVSIVLQSVVYIQAFLTLPIVIARDGLGTAGYGVAIGLNGVLIVALQPLLLTVLGRRGRGELLLVSGVLLGIGFGLTYFADSLLAHMAAITVWTVGEVLGAGQLGALVAALAPVHLRGRYMGVFGLSFGLGALLAPGVGTQLLSHLGEGGLWGGAFVGAVVSGAGLWFVARAAARRTPSPSPRNGGEVTVTRASA